MGLDLLHKFSWVRLLARMFEAMAGNFAYSGDIHLFLNVLNGAVTLHSEDSCVLRYVMATYINAARNFKNIFSSNGYGGGWVRLPPKKLFSYFIILHTYDYTRVPMRIAGYNGVGV